MARANNIRDERGFHNKAARHQLLCPVFAAPGLTTPWCSGPRAGLHVISGLLRDSWMNVGREPEDPRLGGERGTVRLRH